MMAVPSKIKQQIGQVSDPVLCEIEKGQIRRFAKGIGEVDPIHFDEKVAQAAGFASIVAPLTLLGSLCDMEKIFETYDLNPQSTMHAEEEYEFFRPVVAGDVITVTHELADAYPKQAPGGRLLFAVIVTRGRDKRSRDVFKARRVLVELKH
jgi:acyl dehydratase